MGGRASQKDIVGVQGRQPVAQRVREGRGRSFGIEFGPGGLGVMDEEEESQAGLPALSTCSHCLPQAGRFSFRKQPCSWLVSTAHR